MPKQVDVQEVTETILKTAMGLFATKGYKGVSMRQLAKALDMTTGGLYHYFKNKDELYTQMVHKLANQDSEALLEQVSAVSPQEIPQIFLQFLKERSEYFYQVLLILFDHHRYVVDPDHEVAPEFASLFEVSLELYQRTLIDVLGLQDMQAQVLLDYLIGCFTRALLYRRTPDFSLLPLVLGKMLQK